MKKKAIVIMLTLILMITIGYAVIKTPLKINGMATIKPSKFDIHFENVSLADDSIEPIVPIIINDEGNQIEFQVAFYELGSKFEFNTDIVNAGTINGKISNIEVSELTSAESHMLDFDMYYTDNSEYPALGDFLKVGEKRNLTVNLKYELSNELTNEEYYELKNGFEKKFIIKITYEAVTK